MKGALSGCRVLDLTDEKGMFCSRLLAGMGADVIRIDPPGLTPPRMSFFINANLGKRSVTLDIENVRGQDLFRRMLAQADVIVESYRPGYLEDLGLDYVRLEKANPRLIVCSITDFGQAGPYRDLKSSDLVASALGGQMSVCGEPGKPPLKPFGPQAWDTACLFAANGVLLALWGRHATGRGQHIHISVHECVAATLDHVLPRYFYGGVVAEKRGSLHWNNAFRVFQCRDGYILLSLFQHWETLVEWLVDEGMAEDLAEEKWRDRDFRLGHVDHIIEVLERWTKTHSVAELVEKGQLMRFPWAAVNSIPELMASPQLEARNAWVELEDPQTGQIVSIPGAPARLSATPWHVSRYTPIPGEHNIEIYQGELGLSEDELRELKERGII